MTADRHAKHIFLWPQALLFLGHGLNAQAHRHHALQLCFGLQTPLLVSAGAAQLEAEAIYVPPELHHALSQRREAPLALLFLEPESEAGQRCRAHYGPALTACTLGSELRALLVRLAAQTEPRAEAQRIAEALGVGAAPAVLDTRITRSLFEIDAQLQHSTIRLGAVAAAAGLSPSHFAYLFRSQTGVPLRRYVQWRRLRAAISAALQGAALTQAAHAAGFADSAHLSRVFRAMFGLAPSLLTTPRAMLHLHLM